MTSTKSDLRLLPFRKRPVTEADDVWALMDALAKERDHYQRWANISQRWLFGAWWLIALSGLVAFVRWEWWS